MPEMADPTLLALPEALRTQGYAMRAERDDDVPFLQHLYASTRADELAMLPWPQTQREAFVHQQFTAQRQHYRGQFAEAAFAVITRDAAPVGRLYLDRRATRYHVIDIALLPDARGKGLGTALFRALFARASAEGVGVGLMVAQFNPALRLYHRLGFRPVGAPEVYLEMEWHPDAPPDG